MPTGSVADQPSRTCSRWTAPSSLSGIESGRTTNFAPSSSAAAPPRCTPCGFSTTISNREVPCRSIISKRVRICVGPHKRRLSIKHCGDLAGLIYVNQSEFLCVRVQLGAIDETQSPRLTASWLIALSVVSSIKNARRLRDTIATALERHAHSRLKLEIGPLVGPVCRKGSLLCMVSFKQISIDSNYCWKPKQTQRSGE